MRYLAVSSDLSAAVDPRSPACLLGGRCSRALWRATLRCSTFRAKREQVGIGQLCEAGSGQDSASLSPAVLGGRAFSEGRGPRRWSTLIKAMWLGNREDGVRDLFFLSPKAIFQLGLYLSQIQIPGPHPTTTEL